MSNFIEELYYGNIEPQECTSSLTGKVKSTLNKLTEKEEMLTEKFSDEMKEIFADYTSTYNAFSSICCADSFEVGFRLGAKLIYDTFVNN